MKKYVLVIIMLFLLLTGCGDADKNTKGIDVQPVFYSNDDLGIEFTIKYDFETMDIQKKNTSEYGLLISYKELEKDKFIKWYDGVITNTCESIEEDSFFVILNVYEPNDYQKQIYARGYVINNNIILYSDTIITTSLYDVALKSDNTKAAEVVDYCNTRGKIITTVKIDLDTSKKNYTAQALENLYEANLIDDPTKNNVVVKITPINGYKFGDSVTIYVNGVEAQSKDFNIIDGVMTYKIKDPNWTDIY